MKVTGSLLAAAALALASNVATAEDVDVFLDAAGSNAAANVLVVLDNSANWSLPGDSGEPVGLASLQGLSQALRSLDEEPINFGLLLYPEEGETAPAAGDSYVRAPLRPMDAATRDLYARQIESLDIEQDRGASGVSALAFAAAFRHFVESVPAGDGECGRNHLVFISHGSNRDSAATTTEALQGLAGLGGDTDPIAIDPAEHAANAADEWSRFMANSELGVTTTVIEVGGGSDAGAVAWRALLRNVAQVSGGSYRAVADSADSIAEAVQRAVAPLLPVDASFAPAALPLSATGAATYLNRVYLPRFRPDAMGRARWPGNLKHYQLGVDNAVGGGQLALLDARNKPVVDNSADNRGGIRPCALSYWTPSRADTYWNYPGAGQVSGDCLEIPDSSASNFPDGAVVEKGGQAYVGRGGAGYATAEAASRVVKTTGTALCGGSTGRGCAFSEFDGGNGELQAQLSGIAGVGPVRLIHWARGADTEDEDGDGERAEFRPSLHGDVIHSRPLVMDYADDPANPQLVVFYGGNDGMLRAINGNRRLAHNGADEGPAVTAGGEFWAFMPPDFYPELARLYHNQALPFAAAAASEQERPRRPYGPDGPLSSWLGEGGQRYLAMGIRRGGRTIYGMNVSNIASSRLLWRLGCTTELGDDSGCADGWEFIGQTWSALVPAFPPGAATPYVLMGGGYDSCEDLEDPATGANHRCGAATRGNSIYVLQSATGEILRRFPTQRAVAGAVTVVPLSDNDRSISYAYAADTGGNVYRLSGPAGKPIGSSPPASWQITRIADLGCDAGADIGCPANRKFLFGPDVVRLPGTSRYGLLLGSGDREKPTLQYPVTRSVSNYFFALVDDPADPDWLASEVATCGGAIICTGSLTTVPANAAGPVGTPESDKGWKRRLQPGEQVVSGALTLADKVHFSTHRAAEGPRCQRGLGIATSYSLDYRNGGGEMTRVAAGGLAGLLWTTARWCHSVLAVAREMPLWAPARSPVTTPGCSPGGVFTGVSSAEGLIQR